MKELRIVDEDRVVSPLIDMDPEITARERVANPPTVRPLLIVTAPDRVDVPTTTREPADNPFAIPAVKNVAAAEPADRDVPCTSTPPCAVSVFPMLSVPDTNPPPKTFRA